MVFNPLYLPYLESSSRDSWQRADEVLSALQLESDEVVADIGAGGGYFTERIARVVGDSGHVFAVDVQEAMIRTLEERVQEKSLTNVSVIEGEFSDPCLLRASCDVAFFSSVYKEIVERAEYMTRVREALRPGGRVAILEYRPEFRGLGTPSEYRLPASQVVAEMEAVGFELRTRYEFIDRQYYLIFEQAPRLESAGRSGP